MEQPVPCRVTRGGQAVECTARLDKHGAKMGDLPILSYTEVTEVWQYGQYVHIRFPEGEARFDLLDARRARRIARTMEDAPSPLEALGARKGDTVAVLGLPDGWVFRLLRKRRLKGCQAPPASATASLLIVGVSGTRNLAGLPNLMPYLQPGGSLWVVYPRDDEHLRTEDVAAAGRMLALKDVMELHVAPGRAAMKFVAA